jgi:hypothetical protein
VDTEIDRQAITAVAAYRNTRAVMA